jgi:putative copper export protein
MELNSIFHMHCIVGAVITFILLLNWVGTFSPLGIFFTEKPSKEASILQTVSRYFSSFGSLALLLLST